jgi:GT2 family glycosyltransferase
MVIDNASTDGSTDMIRKKFPDIDIFQAGKNLGYTGGINFGIRQARQTPAEYILVLNNDTLVEPDFLTRLVEAMENDGKAAAAGGTIYCEHERTKIWYGGGHLIPWRGLAVHEKKHELVEPSTLNGVRQVSFVTGCMILFRASLLEAIGWEDERFFMYLDDIELSARILAKGYRLLYVPQAIIYHKVLGEKESAFKLYYSARNRLLLIDAGFTGWPKLVARYYFLAVIIGKLLVWRFTNPRFYKAALYGLQDFFSGRFYEGRGLAEFATQNLNE